MTKETKTAILGELNYAHEKINECKEANSYYQEYWEGKLTGIVSTLEILGYDYVIDENEIYTDIIKHRSY